MRFSEVLCYVYIWCLPILILLSRSLPIKERIAVFVVLVLGLFYRTNRRILVKELFKFFYAKRYSIEIGVRGLYLDRNGGRILLLLQLYMFLFAFVILGIVIPHNCPEFITFLILLLILLVLEALLYTISKRHFENPNNITRYYPLYWHCKYLFMEHNRSKNPYIPQVRFTWRKLDAVPYMYFDVIFWSFIFLTVVVPFFICFLFRIYFKESGTPYQFTSVVNLIIFALVTVCGTWYIRWVLRILGCNQVNKHINKIKERYSYIQKYLVIFSILSSSNKKSLTDKTTKQYDDSREYLYVKTVPKTGGQVPLNYALNWSISITSAVYIFSLINQDRNSNWIFLIDTIYVCACLYVIYIALKYHVNKYADVYIKVLSYKGKQFEFYTLTDNWKW